MTFSAKATMQTLNRIRAHHLLVCSMAALVPPAATLAQSSDTSNRSVHVVTHDGQRDFDWQVGTWKVHMSRLQHPLTGSKTWTQLNGTVVVRKVWGGRANLPVRDHGDLR